MPAIQRGEAYRLGPKKWGLRYYAADGARRRKSPFPSKSAALAHYRDVIEPELRGETPALPELTLAELVELYLERHAAGVRSRTIWTLRVRLRYAVTAFGDVPLRDLERMSGEIAAWQAKLPERSRYGLVQALKQTLEAAVRWGHMGTNPARLAGRNRQPSPRPVRAFTPQEIVAISAELSPVYWPLPAFAATTGLRPEEWTALERRDIDRAGAVLTVARTVSGGDMVGAWQDGPQPPAGAALCARVGRARRTAATARHSAAVPCSAVRAVELGQLAPQGVGAGDRGVRGP